MEQGGKITQETRGWDEVKQHTFPQRLKEESHDYRYFPDPDVPKLILSEDEMFSEEKIRESLPELPWERRARLRDTFKLKAEDYEMYTRTITLGDYFEHVADALHGDLTLVLLAANYISSDLVNLYPNGIIEIKPKDFARVIQMINANELSSRGAKDLLRLLTLSEGDPRGIAEKHNLLQKSNEDELVVVITQIIKEYPDVVLDYKSGKSQALQFLLGQGMRATKGSANPNILKKLLETELNV